MSPGLPARERWLLRAVLAFTLAWPLFIWSLSRGLENTAHHSIDFTLASSTDGPLQVFFDRGAGIAESESSSVMLRRTDAPAHYRVPLPSGTYRLFRIDPPGGGGTLTIAAVRLVNGGDGTAIEAPLASITAAVQAQVIAAGPPLVLQVPAGSVDPQLLWRPASPIVLERPWRSTGWMALEIVIEWLGALAAVVALSMALGPAAPLARRWLQSFAGWGAARPRSAIAATALLATTAAMYPVVFLGNSLVSPNNGGAALLYERLPFTPGQTDPHVELVRGTDTGAAMWAFVPYSIVQREALGRGELPLWNRYNGAGRPLLGQGQPLIFDPLHWPFLIAPNLAAGWDISFFLHRLAFAIGVGLCGLVLTGSWSAGAAMAALAPFASYYLFRLNHPAHFVLTYVPFVLLAWFHLQRGRTTRELAGSAAAIGVATALLLFSSPPKEAAVALLCAHATGLLSCLLAPDRWQTLARQLTAAGVGMVLALMITAPQWVTFLDTLGQSITAYDTPAARFATWPFAIAMALGSLTPGMVVPGTHAAAFAAWCASVASAQTWRSPLTIAATLGPALSMAIAFGAIPASIIVRLPLLANLEQIDYTFLAASVALLFVAGSSGAARVIAGHGRGAAAVAAGASLVMMHWLGGLVALDQFVDTWKLLLTCVLAIMLPLTAAAAARRWPEPLPVIATLAIVGAIVAPNGLHGWTPSLRFNNALIQPRQRPSFGENSAALAAIRRDHSDPVRVLGLDNQLLAGSQALYHLEGIAGPDALQLPWTEHLINAAGTPRGWWWRPTVSASTLEPLSPLLDLLGVRYLLTERTGVPDGLAILKTDAPDQLLALRRPTAWPRAFFVDRALDYTSLGELLGHLRQTPGPLALIDAHDQDALREAGLTAGGQAGPPVVAAADQYVLGTNSTRFHLRAPAPGVAVLTEAWMPASFTATINGKAAPIFRVNHAFKGVRIPARGDYTIEFRYWPALLTPALAAAAIGLAGVAALIVFWRTLRHGTS